jgi:hypothetical protein
MDRKLKFPATRCGGIFTVKKIVYFLFERIPCRKQRGMRSLFSLMLSCNSNGSVMFIANYATMARNAIMTQ